MITDMLERLFILCLSLMLTLPLSSPTHAEESLTENRSISYLMKRVRHRIKKLNFYWDLSLFPDKGWSSKDHSVNKLPLLYWSCGDKKAHNRSLILSAVHGDEVTPVYFGFRMVEWLKANPEICKNKFIVVAPMVNPDGFLRYRRGTRTNYNKVDLNRNFDTPDWKSQAHIRWKRTARPGQKPQRRYFPGDKPASEPEIHFQKWLIDEFRPNKIMSIHAPLKFFEFDGPKNDKLRIFAQSYIDAAEALKKQLKKSNQILRFKLYGTFPGSLGNYAGRLKGIATITTELPSSNPRYAARYFGDLEKSTRVFIDFDLFTEAPKKNP